MQAVLSVIKNRMPPLHGQRRLCVALVGATLMLTLAALSAPTMLGSQNQQNEENRTVRDGVQRYLARSEDDKGAIRELFVTGDSEVPSLVKALREGNKQARIRAAKGIAYIGTTPGLDALRSAVQRERDKETKAILSFFLAGRLVDTKSKADFDFLVSSIDKAHGIKDGDDDTEGFPAVSAVLALGLAGKRDCLPVLRKAANLDLADSDEIIKAVHWLEKEPAAPGNESLPKHGSTSSEEEQIRKAVLDRTFFAEGDETSIDNLTLNGSRNEALVSLSVGSGPKNKRGYDLVLTKVDGGWRVAGAWFSWIS